MCISRSGVCVLAMFVFGVSRFLILLMARSSVSCFPGSGRAKTSGMIYPNRPVTTKDGQTFSGRLEAETQTTVEVLDTTGQKHVVQRKEITSLDASQLSIMPAGFESLPADDLKALVEYLAQSIDETAKVKAQAPRE